MQAAYYSRANSYSKSYNATMAEREGRYPATIFKQEYGIDPRKVVRASEWHHVGKFANRVDYYVINDKPFAIFTMGLRPDVLGLEIYNTAQWGRAFRKAVASGIYRLKSDVKIIATGNPNFFQIVKK